MSVVARVSRVAVVVLTLLGSVEANAHACVLSTAYEGGGCSASPFGTEPNGALGLLSALMLYAAGRRKK